MSNSNNYKQRTKINQNKKKKKNKNLVWRGFVVTKWNTLKFNRLYNDSLFFFVDWLLLQRQNILFENVRMSFVTVASHSRHKVPEAEYIYFIGAWARTRISYLILHCLHHRYSKTIVSCILFNRNLYDGRYRICWLCGGFGYYSINYVCVCICD